MPINVSFHGSNGVAWSQDLPVKVGVVMNLDIGKLTVVSPDQFEVVKDNVTSLIMGSEINQLGPRVMVFIPEIKGVELKASFAWEPLPSQARKLFWEPTLLPARARR